MILTLGDSIASGQGLLEEHKFDRLLADALGTDLLRLAHSGAILGKPDDGPAPQPAAHGEVPVPYPSVWQQLHDCNAWDTIDLVLLNGGMNDVNLERILSPWVSPDSLAPAIDEACYDGILALLLAIASRLTQPGAKIVVLSYYPILSRHTEYPSQHHSDALLQAHGVASPALVPERLVPAEELMTIAEDSCIAFWKRSSYALSRAVAAANVQLPNARCRFLELPFNEENVVWAPDSLLFALTNDLGPEESMAETRREGCTETFNALLHPYGRYRCIRASAGHPSEEGAARIAEALQAALR